MNVQNLAQYVKDTGEYLEDDGNETATCDVRQVVTIISYCLKNEKNRQDLYTM